MLAAEIQIIVFKQEALTLVSGLRCTKSAEDITVHKVLLQRYTLVGGGGQEPKIIEDNKSKKMYCKIAQND